jgi:predicted ester cyclase
VEDIIRNQRETVDEHIRHENAKNWSGVYDTFVHDETAFYDVVPFNTRFPGFAGVKGFYEAANVAFPDFKIDVWGEYDSPGCSVREVTISGTHKGDWCGLPGTGRHIRFQLGGRVHLAAYLAHDRVVIEIDSFRQQFARLVARVE